MADMKCPCCGAVVDWPEDERDPEVPEYALNPCDPCCEEELGGGDD